LQLLIRVIRVIDNNQKNILRRCRTPFCRFADNPKKRRKPFPICGSVFSNRRFTLVNHLSLRWSRAGFYFFAAAKKSKQKRPSHTQIPKNQIAFLKSGNSLRSNSPDFLTKNNMIFFTEFG
jgi:hypothetical protein